MAAYTLTTRTTTAAWTSDAHSTLDADSPEHALDLAHAQLRLDQRREAADPETWTIEATAPGGTRASREVVA